MFCTVVCTVTVQVCTSELAAGQPILTGKPL